MCGGQRKKTKFHKFTFCLIFLAYEFYSVFIHLQTSGSLDRVETLNGIVNIHILDMFTLQKHIKPMIHTQHTGMQSKLTLLLEDAPII